ncbi:hypothetical protein [Nostoc flagelliforme]|uniref:hypothetical protein n=1 Tax=Nostoc flagelliforme TaxID=1306274 RepID=UPI0012FDBC99
MSCTVRKKKGVAEHWDELGEAGGAGDAGEAGEAGEAGGESFSFFVLFEATAWLLV